MLDVHDRAVEPQAHGRRRIVELAVVGAGGDHVVHVLAGNDSGNQLAHQQPRDRRVAVGKVKDVRLFFLARRQTQPVEARVSEGLVVVGTLIAGGRGNGFDADRPEIVGERLKKWQGFGS